MDSLLDVADHTSGPTAEHQPWPARKWAGAIIGIGAGILFVIGALGFLVLHLMLRSMEDF